MPSTATRTGTQTSSLTKVVYVTRKVQADLFAVIDTYNYFSEDHAAKIITDIRIFLDNEVIDYIKLIWRKAGTTEVLEELQYEVVAGNVGMADDRPGGVGYNALLKDADFNARVIYNQRWNNMDADEKQVVREALVLSWGAGDTLSYSNGSWKPIDKSYSQNGQDGLTRQRFSR